MTVKTQIIGLEKLDGNLNRLSKRVPDEVRKLMLEVAMVDIESYAKINPIPVDTGRLRASINTKYSSNQQFIYSDGAGNSYNGTLGENIDINSILVGTNVEYAQKMNRSGGGGENSGRTSKGNKKPKGYGKGFMDNAFLNGKTALYKAIAKLSKRVDKL